MDASLSFLSGDSGWQNLQKLVETYSKSGIYILVDTNTKELCLPILTSKIDLLQNAVVISIPEGETAKNIGTVEHIWTELMANYATRNSLLICLGGGVVTDMGAFAATAFKRGMHFVLIPTSLLAMVDAAIGGKAAVNFGDIKNQIGLFTTPDQIYVFPDFLQTLPHRQKLSGYAEMIKHALLHSRDLFDTFIKINSPEKACTEEAIIESASVKQSFVKNDITETGIRKVLNLGHTIGHALESYTLKNDAKPLLHGEAIAVGLICESFISMRMAGFSESDLRQLASLINWQFPHYRFAPGSADELIRIMGHDKKNNNGQKLNFSLLKNVGEPVIDQVPGERLIRESLHFYTNLQVGFFV